MKKFGLVGQLVLAMAVSGSVAMVQAGDPVAEEMAQALKLTPDLKNGKDMYEVCSSCHLPEGWGLPDGTFPQISGQHRSVLIKQLEDIRVKNRDNPTMYPFAQPNEIGGIQGIADVTAYIAKLPMSPENGVGPGTDLAHGEKLYKDNCARCHGEKGDGHEAKAIPVIHGQHFNYLVRQFETIKTGKRKNANPDMVKQIAGFSEKDTNAVLDYTARLRPAPEKVAPKGWKNPDF